MKAIVYYGPGDVRLEDRPKPVPLNNNLIVEVKCCAICGSDLKMFVSGNPRCRPPRIIGHEMAGRIVHKGSDVEGFELGDRVTLATTVGCGKCYYCSIGLSNLCLDSMPISNAVDGAFAEYIAIPPEAISGGNVIKIPDSVSYEAAALSEPLSCAINSQELAGVKEGDKVLIIGGGPLGALHAELAKALGASDVILSGRSEKRLKLLSPLKDIILVNSSETNLESVIEQRTNGLGVDVVIVGAPIKEAHENSIKYVRKGGTVSYFASIPKGSSDITFDSRIVHYGELRIVGASDSRPEHVAKAVSLLAEGKINTDAIITHRIPIEEFHKGFELMKKRECLKIIVYPGGVQE